MRNSQATTKPGASVETLAGDMCALLEAMLVEHRAMIAVVERRKEALRRARINDLNACIAEESVIAQRIAHIDQRRDAVVRQLVPLLGGAPIGSPRGWRPTAEWLAPRIGGPLGERVRAVAGKLREAIESLRAANASTREAAETVARHIQGIVRSVEQRLSGSGAYTNRGVVSAAPSALCGVDLTS
jgi:hypothetical protein